MEIIFTNKVDDQKTVVKVKSVGFDLGNTRVYVWDCEGCRVTLDSYETDFVIVLPGPEGGEQNVSE